MASRSTPAEREARLAHLAGKCGRWCHECSVARNANPPTPPARRGSQRSPGTGDHRGVNNPKIYLADPGSCKDPGTQTITRAEWLAQQEDEVGRQRLSDMARPSAPQPPEQKAFAPKMEKPEGRYIAVITGKRYSGTTFHLFGDCGNLLGGVKASATNGGRWYGGGSEEANPEYKIIDVSDEMIFILALTVCKNCDNRTKLLSLDDVIDSYVSDEVAFTAAECTHFRRGLIAHLAKYGFVIRQEHKRQPQLQEVSE